MAEGNVDSDSADEITCLGEFRVPPSKRHAGNAELDALFDAPFAEFDDLVKEITSQAPLTSQSERKPSGPRAPVRKKIIRAIRVPTPSTSKAPIGQDEPELIDLTSEDESSPGEAQAKGSESVVGVDFEEHLAFARIWKELRSLSPELDTMVAKLSVEDLSKVVAFLYDFLKDYYAAGWRVKLGSTDPTLPGETKTQWFPNLTFADVEKAVLFYGERLGPNLHRQMERAIKKTKARPVPTTTTVHRLSKQSVTEKDTDAEDGNGASEEMDDSSDDGNF